MLKQTSSAGGVVVNPDGKILIVDQGRSWSLPKGHVENGETILDAAKREIFEESGVKDLNLIRKFKSYKRQGLGSPDEMKTIYMFLFRTTQVVLKPQVADSHGAIWVDKEKAADMLTHPKDKEFLSKVLSEL